MQTILRKLIRSVYKPILILTGKIKKYRLEIKDLIEQTKIYRGCYKKNQKENETGYENVIINRTLEKKQLNLT